VQRYTNPPMQQNCHPDRSVPGFPTSRCQRRPRVRFSVELTTGFAEPCLGAPRSHQRTWVDKDGAKPHQSSDNPSPKQILGAPYLARFWRDVGFHCSIPEDFPAKCTYPALRIKAKDGNRSLSLLGEPHEVHQRHEPQQEIRGSAVEGPAISFPVSPRFAWPGKFLERGVRDE
jgi:hypothetical protein